MPASAAKAAQPKASTTGQPASAPRSKPSGTTLVDNRPVAVAQRRMQEMMNQSPQVQQAAAQQARIAQSPWQQPAAQRLAMTAPVQRKANRTGLPDDLKAGVENLSGYSLDDVKVHYNSAKPAELQAHAYAQGTDIHVAPGQEEHLPHEAWHVVQQKQGRVRATRQLKGVGVNDESALEKEADAMGSQAMQRTVAQPPLLKAVNAPASGSPAQLTAQQAVPTTAKWEENPNGAKAGAPEIQNSKLAPHPLVGSVPSAYPVGWTTVLGKASKVKGSWVRFHLINHNIGGSGKDEKNLVPTTPAINSGVLWSSFETDVKNHWNNNEWIWCKVSVEYPSHAVDEGFPEKITGRAEWYDAANGAWRKMAQDNTQLTLTQPNFTGGTKLRTLDEMTAATWALVTGLGATSRQVNYLNYLSSMIADIDDFNEALYEENAPEFSDEAIAGINAAIKGHADAPVHIAVSY